MTIMIKILGALMLTGGAAVIGLRAAEKLNYRVGLYSALAHSIDLMQAEIFFRLTSLPELMLQLSRQIEAPANLLFANCYEQLSRDNTESFCSIWDHALHESIERDLSSVAMQSLRELGSILGRYDAKTQSDALTHALKRIEGCYESARREKERQSRVYGVLGLVSGLAAVIILI